MAYTLPLNAAELAEIAKQDPRTKGDGGFQSFMVRLQDLVDHRTKTITITDDIAARAQKYAFKYGNGGWEDRLTSIFGRHLGSRLDQIPKKN
ncbi:MAG: aspartyl-tRNA synthetase [Akkermansiaceae bacterium]|nr:aspartyl-tRNA synthetase [Akkermansiaceae bacterium]